MAKSSVNIKQEVEDEEEEEDLLPLSKIFNYRGALPTVFDEHVEEPTSNNLLINTVKVENSQDLNEFPSFVKYMLRSHVTHGFWMSLPSEFSKMYMPKETCRVTLVDESEEEYVTNYISSSHALSGGWKRFSIAHGLVEGDTVIFHLVEAAKFKVTIIRTTALQNMKPLTPLKKIDSRKHINTGKRNKVRRPRMRKLSALQPSPNEFETFSAEDTSEVLEGIKLSRNRIKLENFVSGQSSSSLIVNGMSIDSELPDATRLKYYKLCCSQNACLHEKLIKGLNCKLVAGLISETVGIADAIEAGNLRFSSYEFDLLDKCLGAFEHMGMKVAFLRDQLQQAVDKTTNKTKVMAEHGELRQRKRGDYESGKKGNSMKHKKLSSLGAVDTKNFFERQPCHEEDMDDFMKTWMY